MGSDWRNVPRYLRAPMLAFLVEPSTVGAHRVCADEFWAYDAQGWRVCPWLGAKLLARKVILPAFPDQDAVILLGDITAEGDVEDDLFIMLFDAHVKARGLLAVKEELAEALASLLEEDDSE